MKIGLNIDIVKILHTNYNWYRYIKMSSPNMNNIIIIGCMVSYASVYLLGSQGGGNRRVHSSSVCVVSRYSL